MLAVGPDDTLHTFEDEGGEVSEVAERILELAYIFYHRGVAGSEFDAGVGIAFSQSRLTSSTALGIGVASGDFNGDGLPDVAAGDSQSTPARVEVWY
jgi:hypothetical protein